MTFPYRAERIEEAAQYFDRVVKRIQEKRFRVEQKPEPAICKECDLRPLCLKEDLVAREA